MVIVIILRLMCRVWESREGEQSRGDIPSGFNNIQALQGVSIYPKHSTGNRRTSYSCLDISYIFHKMHIPSISRYEYCPNQSNYYLRLPLIASSFSIISCQPAPFQTKPKHIDYPFVSSTTKSQKPSLTLHINLPAHCEHPISSSSSDLSQFCISIQFSRSKPSSLVCTPRGITCGKHSL
jgi:hypothetical protein